MAGKFFTADDYRKTARLGRIAGTVPVTGGGRRMRRKNTRRKAQRMAFPGLGLSSAYRPTRRKSVRGRRPRMSR
jgi:hypothetical protein